MPEEINSIEKSDSENYGVEKPEEILFKTEVVTDRDKFKLAKGILLIAALFYLILGLSYAIFPSKEFSEKAKEVWDFSKVFLTGVISTVIGYYFGSQTKTN